MSNQEYLEAVAFAKVLLSNLQSFATGQLELSHELTVNARRGVLRGASLATKILYFRRDTSRRLPNLYSASVVYREVMDLVERSRTDPSAFDELATCSKICLAKGIRMPLRMRSWAGDVLQGARSRPPTPANKLRAKEYELLFDLTIKQAVEKVAIRFDCLTYKDKSKNWSACEVVAKALLDNGLKPTSAHQVYKVINRLGGANLQLARISSSDLPNLKADDPFDGLLSD